MLADKTYKNNASRLQSLLRNYNPNQIIEDYVLNDKE